LPPTGYRSDLQTSALMALFLSQNPDFVSLLIVSCAYNATERRTEVARRRAVSDSYTSQSMMSAEATSNDCRAER
jgi:hypothetical protein